MKYASEARIMRYVIWALLILPLTLCRSPPSPPLKRLSHPTSSSLEILRRNQPRSLAHTLRHDDTILLTAHIPFLPHPAHLLLSPTEHLFHPDAKVTYQDGSSESLRQEDWRMFTGNVIHPKWVERVKSEQMAGMDLSDLSKLGSASIMVHHPGDGTGRNPVYEGSFNLQGETYHILTSDHYQKVKTAHDVHAEMDGMVVFRDSDMYHDHPTLETETASCSHDNLAFNFDPFHPVNSLGGFGGLENSSGMYRRDDIAGGNSGGNNYINSIGNPAGCPDTQKVLYMGVAIDCNYITTYGDATAARTQVLNNWNQASALYRSTFNVSLGIVELKVQNQSCPATPPDDAPWDVSCDANMTMDQRLSSFSQWRGTRQDDGIGLWHLMSACPTDTEVGVAWLGTLCQTSANQQSGSYVSGTGMSTAAKTEWSLISHEIGHGFGAIHDCTSGCSLSGPCCPLTNSQCNANGQYIMNPTTSSTEKTFSQCTLGNICSGLGSRTVSSSCLIDPSQGGRTVISLQQCGNGIVDEGEECDPGSGSNSTCCDQTTCKFVSGAVCDPANSACCTGSCQYASSGTVCRPAVDATCDYAETCTGTNATCPADKTAPDGKSCGSNGLACAAGQCTSLNEQCQKAGSSMNLSQACGQKDDTSCVISCRDPRSSNQCIVLQTALLDGSPCGYGGHCYNQTCQSGPWQDTAGAWYRQNLQISIPVTVVAGVLVLAILFFLARCIFRCCARKRGRRSAGTSGIPPSMRQSRFPPPPMPISRTENSLSSTDGITTTNVVQQESGSARNSWAAPPPPPPSQDQYQIVNANNYQNNTTPSRQSYGNGGYGQMGYGSPSYSGGMDQRLSSGGYPQQRFSSGGYTSSPTQNHQRYPSGNQGGWVDPALYNGPHYGPSEAYGR